MQRENVVTFTTAEDYNNHWEGLRDFIAYNPGARHRRRMTLGLIEGLSFKNCLDVGCGTGEIMKPLVERHPDVAFTGSDYSDKTMTRNQELFPSCRFVTLDIEKSHLDEQFDLVICCEVIEHLHDRKAAFKNFAAMLKPGSHLLITCPTGKIFATEKIFGHTTHPTHAELKEHARANGLVIRRYFNWGFPFYYLLKFLTNINPEAAMKSFGSGSYCWPQKLVCNVLYAVNFLNLKLFPWGCQIFCLMQRPAEGAQQAVSDKR